MQTVGQNLSKGSTTSPSLLEQLGTVEKIPAAMLLGLLLALSGTGLGLWWLPWVALSPLLVLCLSCRGAGGAFWVGLAFGGAYELLSHRWILELHPLTMFEIPDLVSLIGVVLMWVVESLHGSLLFAGFAALVGALPMRSGLLPHLKRPFFPFLLSVPLIWVFFRWVVAPSELFWGLPVSQLVYSQTGMPAMIQICSIGGAPLLELLVVLSNCALALLLTEFLPHFATGLPRRVDRLSARGGALCDLFLVLACILGCWSFGEWRLKRVTDLPPYSIALEPGLYAPPVPVAVLQGNLAVKPERFRFLDRKEPIDRYVSLVGGLGVCILVLPEALLRLEEEEGRLLASMLRGVCLSQKKEVIVGSLETVRSSLVNVVRLVSESRVEECFYVKNRLLPLIESVPFAALAKAIPDNLLRLLPSSRNSFLEAPTPFLLRSVWGKIGASVSFEVVYPELLAQEVEDGASLLVNVADLSWFHDTSLSRQLLAAASMRAVENGRYLIVASNTGVSAVINPLGIVTSRTESGQQGNIIDRVQFLFKRTLFTRAWWLWRPAYRIFWH